MLQVGVLEASQTLSSLLDSVQQGEVILITRDGKPIARLIPEALPSVEDSFETIEQRVAKRAAEMKIKFDWNEFKQDRDADRP